nr:uncharacterized protein LOC111510609 [Leptinotarsa decemlineata]
MSAENDACEGDLIDFHVRSPILPRASTASQPETSDHLLDTELPVLEEKLQTAAYIAPSVSRRPSVDIEDILISIDDDYDLVDAPQQEDNNSEALPVLHSLDDGLDTSLNNPPTSDGSTQAQQDIEDCLLDLDNYLKSLDPSSEDESNSSGCEEPSSVDSSSNPTNPCGLEAAPVDDETLRNRLRRIEENYRRYLASGCVNRGYIDTEPERERRPSSACEVAIEAKKTSPARATVSVIRRKRPSLREVTDNCVKSRCTPDRKPGPAGDSDEEIDWSWLQDIARDVTLERRAHATGDCCTGTVVLEAPRTMPVPSSSSAPAMDEEDTAHKSTWLRSSMRRLRHVRLPSDQADEDNSAAEESATVTIVPVTAAYVATPPNVATVPAAAVRPMSAPSRIPTVGRTAGRSSRPRSRESGQSAVSLEPSGRARSSSASSRSRRPRSLSSSESSIPSSLDSTPSTPAASTQTNQEPAGQATNNERSCDRNRQTDMPEVESPLGHWPHSLSSMMACLSCTLGLFNISRFSILSIHFGANFIFQFCFLSVVFGLPLFTLQLCLGQQLGAGVIDMWRISPLFQGVGVSLLIAQALMGLYSVIGVSWLFVFFRDSFITKLDTYRWAESFSHYRHDLPPSNETIKLEETLPDYFNGVVLQRHHLPTGNAYATIKFQLAFNLAVVWMIVFVSLSKGLRSYGKVVYAFTLLPVFGTFILCAKILGIMPPKYVNVIFPETSWGEFFLNPKSWLAAGQETFLTWGLLGAATMQIASHNKHKHLLQRDSSLVAVITFTILLLVAFLANTCVQILKSNGYSYLPNSFERMSSYTFLRQAKDPLPPSLASTPVRYMVHSSFIVGEKVIRPGVDVTNESGYQNAT